jgi:hypothetical protein
MSIEKTNSRVMCGLLSCRCRRRVINLMRHVETTSCRAPDTRAEDGDMTKESICGELELPSFPLPSLYRPNSFTSIVIINRLLFPPLIILPSLKHQIAYHVGPFSLPSAHPSDPHCLALLRSLTPGQCLPPAAMPSRSRHQSRQLLKKLRVQRTQGYWSDA